MANANERQINEAAYRQNRQAIDEAHQVGQFVAIFGGEVVANAATFAELNALLERQGITSRDVLVVQAGVEYPESVMIL